MSSPGWAQEVKLTSLQSEVVLLEPAFLRITCDYATPPEKIPSFALLVDGKDTTTTFKCGMFFVEEPDGKGGTRLRSEGSCHLGEEGFRIDLGDGATCTYESLRVLSEYGPSPFPGPGTYKISARERHSGAVSKELLLTVKKGTECDRALAEAIKGLHRDKTARVLREAVVKCPESPMAKYARFRLLEWEVERTPLLRSNAPEELESLRAYHASLVERYGDLTTALPSPSPWHFEAGMALANSRAWNGRSIAREEWLKLHQIYGKNRRNAKEIRARLDSIERQIGPGPK